MKSLYTYIDEARAHIEFPLSLEEFSSLVLSISGWDDRTRDDLLEKLPEKYRILLINYLEGYFDFNKDEDKAYINKFYAELCATPLERLERTLGIGGYGAVIDLGNGKVIKWFHAKFAKEQEASDMIKFYTYCREHPHRNFPVVYKVTDQYVIMEKLKVATPKVKKYMIGFRNEREIAGYVKSDIPLKFNRDIPEEVVDWHIECCKYVDAALGREAYPGDMRADNVGERLNGEIVWFDI